MLTAAGLVFSCPADLPADMANLIAFFDRSEINLAFFAKLLVFSAFLFRWVIFTPKKDQSEKTIIMHILFIFAIVTATLVSAQAPTRYRIDSISGTSSIGDGSAATSALLGFPNSVLADSKGGFYIGDDQTFRIRYVAANGTITTVVGNGSAGLTPDGVAGLENTVTSVAAMAISSNGDLYFVDPVSCIVSPAR